MNYTDEQRKVIDERDRQILVSAAAGSGKTAVLVERIISLICDKDEPCDIDKMLIVTFTNAAAAEMRERIRGALIEKEEEFSEDDDMKKIIKKQILLTGHAKITTIDSFCKSLVEDHFEEAGIVPGFTVGDSTQIAIMLKNSLQSVMENCYDRKKELYGGFYEDWINLTQSYSGGADDEKTADMIERLYRFTASLPKPEEWLDDAVNAYEGGENELNENIKACVIDFLKGCIILCESAMELCLRPGGPEVYLDTLESERDLFEEAIELLNEDFSKGAEAVRNISFARIPAAKGDVDPEIKEFINDTIRRGYKDEIKSIKENYLNLSDEEIKEDMHKAAHLIRPLCAATKELWRVFKEDKADEKIIDFSDMEHMALKILYDENGQLTPVALMYKELYRQVMIDEYQDSNEVQELILSAVARTGEDRPDLFMVGDMKQSIYKFRMARPEIFLEKFKNFSLTGEGGKIRIDLKDNFRSRKNVIDSVNDIFSFIMRAEVGGIDYDDSAALKFSAEYTEPEDREKYDTELLIFNRKDAEGQESILRPAEGEARIIGRKISEIISDGKMLIKDKSGKGQRRVRYSDIAILMRSGGEYQELMEETLKNMGIPIRTATGKGYFSEPEVALLLNMLTVIDDPHRDIPFAAVLRSVIGGFDDDELAAISLVRRDERSLSFYDRFMGYENEKKDRFLEMLNGYRRKSRRMSVHDLLYEIVCDHGIFEYAAALPGGAMRRSNVEMLLQKACDYENLMLHGLFGFLKYIERLKEYEIEFSGSSNDDEDSVSLMSIHKSKGLEFPVCFVSGLSKKINKEDLSKEMLLDQDMGIGIEARDPARCIRRDTMFKRMIRRKLATEQMGEEIRVFYVALTRAREKLILTGAVDGFEEKRDKISSLYAREIKKPFEERKVAVGDVIKCSSYAELLEYADAISGEKEIFKTYIYNENDILEDAAEKGSKTAIGKEILLDEIRKYDGGDDGLRQRIGFEYPHREYEGLYTKTSVSELKHAAIHEDEQTNVVFETDVKSSVIPLFVKGNEDKAGGAARGSAYHRFMELLEFKSFDGIMDKDEILKGIMDRKEGMVTKKRMQKADCDLVDMNKIAGFLLSDLGQDMIRADAAGKLKKEQPFVMNIPARRLKPDFPDSETVLIQGIIDAFYEKDGNIILMDYKTDRVGKKEDLISRYQVQIDYYKEALTRITGKTVAAAFLYSFSFSDSIAI